MKNDKVITVKNLSVVFRDIPALWEVSFDVPRGKLLAIVGPNGAGKSTLLKAILGLVTIKSGNIQIDGEEHTKLKEKYKHFAYVPQRESIDWNFPTSCLDVVTMGRYGHVGWFRRPGQNEKDLAMKALEKFGMEKYANKQIGELSGGQQQRIFLARAYVQDADIYFLDEPFGGIDAKTERLTLDLLQNLRNEGKTIVVVTHDLQSLKEYFDCVLLINTQCVAYGSPEEVLSNNNLKAAYGGTMHMVYETRELEANGDD